MTSLMTRGEKTTLLDLLDRLLDTGVVVAGDLTLAVAEVDLIFASLRLVVTSVDKIWETKPHVSGVGEPPDLPRPGENGPPFGPASPAGGAPLAAAPAKAVLPDPTGGESGAFGGSGSQPLERTSARVPGGDFDPQKAGKGVVQLAVTIAELLRQLLEREALRRMERGTLAAWEVERLGQAFHCMEEKVREVKEFFNLKDEEINLDLGPLGKLM